MRGSGVTKWNRCRRPHSAHSGGAGRDSPVRCRSSDDCRQEEGTGCTAESAASSRPSSHPPPSSQSEDRNASSKSSPSWLRPAVDAPSALAAANMDVDAARATGGNDDGCWSTPDGASCALAPAAADAGTPCDSGTTGAVGCVAGEGTAFARSSAGCVDTPSAAPLTSNGEAPRTDGAAGHQGRARTATPASSTPRVTQPRKGHSRVTTTTILRTATTTRRRRATAALPHLYSTASGRDGPWVHIHLAQDATGCRARRQRCRQR